MLCEPWLTTDMTNPQTPLATPLFEDIEESPCKNCGMPVVTNEGQAAGPFPHVHDHNGAAYCGLSELTEAVQNRRGNVAEAVARRNAAIRRLKDEGETLRAIAAEAHMTHVAVAKILKEVAGG